MKRIPIFVVASLITHSAIASEQRQAGAHVHGLNTLQLALEGSRLEIRYQMPIVQLNGSDPHEHEHEHEHEHSHAHNEKHDDNHASLDSQLDALEKHTTLFNLPQQAQCTQTEFSTDVQTVASESGHDHDHDHNHEKDGDAGHRDVFAAYAFECADPAQLNRLEITAFSTYDDLEAVEVEAATARGATRQRITKDNTQVNL